ncbi:MAG: hypothetical protein M5R36_20305 [Deltaproteobacteria bacterium]|nr:hypothetical protein [Deltaproteobacteria bacterium]
MAWQIAANIKEHEVVDGALRDFVNWRDWGQPTVAESVQLSYVDLPVIAELAKRDETWAPIYRRNKRLLADGRTDKGLFYASYDFSKKTYQGVRQNTINQLYAALFLEHDGVADSPTLAFFKSKMAEDGKVLAEYDATTGEPTRFFRINQRVRAFGALRHARRRRSTDRRCDAKVALDAESAEMERAFRLLFR